MAEEVLGVELVDDADASHDAGSVGGAEALSDMDLHRAEATLGEHFGGGSPLSPVMNLAFSDEAEGYVCQLYQIAAGAYAAVLGDKRMDASVNKLGEKLDSFGVDAAFGLDERAYSGNHCGAYKHVVEGLTGTRGV